MAVRGLITQRIFERRHQAMADQLEPNPCERLTLLNQETGETIQLVCDSKRCHDCGPRKQKILKMQLQTMGPNVWVATIKLRADVDRALERAKKRSQRKGQSFTYNIVGDDYLGYIVVSDAQLHPEQRFMAIADWWDRILHAYRYGDNRIRRSRALGRMSLVTLKAVVKEGTSKWRALFRGSGASLGKYERDLNAHIRERDEWTDEHGHTIWAVWEEGDTLRSTISEYSYE
jgi:hypothetical protein